MRKCSYLCRRTQLFSGISGVYPCRQSNTLPNATIENNRNSPLSHTRVKKEKSQDESNLEAPRDYKYVYPEFLPQPDPRMRDKLTERLERRDMLRRRAVIDIPEFYVGSIMAVTVSDKHAPGKKSRFVGLCIQRDRIGLRANFTLRNVIDGQGVEVRYDLYSPLLLNVEVLKLEKRLDDELFYLRDCDPIHSTVPFDMEPIILPPGSSVPVNDIKVKLNPKPWDMRWELKRLKGVSNMDEVVGYRRRARANHEHNVREYENYDLMKQYRESINEEETAEIMSEVYTGISRIEKEKTKSKKSKATVAKTTEKKQ